MGTNNGCAGLVVVVIGLVVTLILILVPLSFKTLEYYEYGFRRRETTGTVDKSTVYAGGIHLIGPDYKFKIFKANAHFLHFDRVTVFASDRLQVEISANMQYFLRQHQLINLHENYDINYETILKNNALDAMKGAATVYSTREFIHSRMKVEDYLFKVIRERLGGVCCEKSCPNGTISTAVRGSFKSSCHVGCKLYSTCRQADYGLFVEVRYFQLHELSIPDELNQRFLQSLVLGESALSEQLHQDARITRQQTEALAKQIENQAVETSQNATALSNLMTSRARADAMAMKEQARSSGLHGLYAKLGLNTADKKLAFDYLRTLRQAAHTNMAVDYNQLVSLAQK